MIKHLQKHILDVGGIASVEPSLEGIADGVDFFQGEIDHLLPVIPGIVNFESVCSLA